MHLHDYYRETIRDLLYNIEGSDAPVYRKTLRFFLTETDARQEDHTSLDLELLVEKLIAGEIDPWSLNFE